MAIFIFIHQQRKLLQVHDVESKIWPDSFRDPALCTDFILLQ